MSLPRRFAAKARHLLSTLKSSYRTTGLHLDGPFFSYEDALANAQGYHDPVILKKVYSAVTDVLNAHGKYERDGTVFSCYPSDLKIRQLLQKYLVRGAFVVDFGGGLGGTFINHRDLFDCTHRCCVIEQSNFVDAGRVLASEYNLSIEYHESLHALKDEPDFLVVSSVLQYIHHLEAVLCGLAILSPKFIVFDRTAFLDRGKPKWWLQVENTYYGTPISYPFRPLKESMILKAFPDYSVLDRWTNSFDPQRPVHRGLLLQRRS